MGKTDEQLITDYLTGQKTALNELIGRYLNSVYAFVYRLTNTRSEAEDITQEVFIKLWRNIKKYKTGQNFKAWLFTIAKNASIDWLRKKRDLTFSDFENFAGENILTETLRDQALMPDALTIVAESRNFLDKLVAKLRPIYREIMALRYQNEYSFEEIAKTLNRPVNTVKSQHRRALIEMQKKANETTAI